MFLYNYPNFGSASFKPHITKSKSESRSKHASNSNVKTSIVKSGKGNPRKLTKKSHEYLKQLGLKLKASKKKK